MIRRPSPPRRLRAAVRQRVPGGWRAPLVGLLGGHRLLRRLLADHADVPVIEAELAALAAGPWHEFRSGSPTAGRTERVVEIPWVLSRYRDEPRVLDVGPAFAHPVYTDRLARLGATELHGVDLAARRIPGMRLARADVRALPFPDAFFALVLCVSAIEHVGLDNSRYGLTDDAATTGDADALRELRRVLAPGARILITVPFGRRERQSWFRQYDLAAWSVLVGSAGLAASELAYYAHGPAGWRQVTDPATLADRAYGEGGLPGAAAVLCATLVSA